VLFYLITKTDGVYLDLTVGKAVSAQARVYGFEIDEQAAEIARERLKPFSQVREIRTASYVELSNWMHDLGEVSADGILLDLGLSSLQLDHPERGFMFRDDGPLDMRFDPQSERPSAADILAQYTEKELAELFWTYGEERQAKRIATHVVRERRNAMIQSTRQLADIVGLSVHPKQKIKSLARVFQALRIVVNEELERITSVLPKAVSSLSIGGRFAVISYHSLEDRLIKHYFQNAAKSGLEVALPNGHVELRQFNLPFKRVIEPSEKEIAQNSRARSAKLRVIERVES
jgi:16S rRNA (cytosine1402-N4)-methyltransferase